MKKYTGQVTLGIGDGGNDVIMIQSSDVGVGIRGKEGQQAARAADYVLSEFQHLQRLLCLHGVNSLSRSWSIANYSFYKSLIFCILQSLYNINSSFSGVSLFNSLQVTLYNIFLFVPIVSMVTKQIYSSADLLSNPSIYRYYNDSLPNRKATFFTVKEYAKGILVGLVEAVVLELLVLLGLPNASKDEYAEVIFTANLFTQDLIMLVLLPNISWLNVGCLMFGHGGMWLLFYICSSIPSLSGFVPYMSMQ